VTILDGCIHHELNLLEASAKSANLIYKVVMNTSTQNARYTTVAILLHWLIGLAILAQLALGLWMVELPKAPPGLRSGWFNIHKSIGLTIAVLIVIRVLWRVTHQAPALPSGMPAWQVKLTTGVHHLLYLLMVFVPTTGILGSVFSKYPIKYFGIDLPRLAEPDAGLKEFFGECHEISTTIIMVLIGLHILAALKHRFIDKDDIFQRMSVKR